MNIAMTRNKVSKYRSTILGVPRKMSFVILMVFLLAGFVYTFLWQNVPVKSHDTGDYIETAIDISDGHIDNLNKRPIGLPLLIYLTDSHTKPNKTFWFAQLFFYLLTIWLSVIILVSLNVSEKIIYVFVLLMLLPFNISIAGYLLTENLSQFCIILTLFGLIKWYQKQNIIYIILAALAASYAALTRPTYQLLILPLILVLFLFTLNRLLNIRVFMKAAIPFAVIFGLIIGGYSFLNYSKFGYFGLTYMVGYNLCTKTAPFLEDLPEQYSNIKEFLIETRNGELIELGSSHTGRQYIWAIGTNKIEEKLNMSTSDAGKYMLKLNLTLIKKSPVSYMQQVAEAMVRYWFPASNELANMNSKVLQLIWMLIHFIIITLFFLQLTIILSIGIFTLSSIYYKRSMRFIKISKNNSNLLLAYLITTSMIFYTFFVTCLADVGSPRQRGGDALIYFGVILGLSIVKKCFTYFYSIIYPPHLADFNVVR